MCRVKDRLEQGDTGHGMAMHHARETRHVEISFGEEKRIAKLRPYKYDIRGGCRNIAACLVSAVPKAVSKRKGCTRMRLPSPGASRGMHMNESRPRERGRRTETDGIEQAEKSRSASMRP